MACMWTPGLGGGVDHEWCLYLDLPSEESGIVLGGVS